MTPKTPKNVKFRQLPLRMMIVEDDERVRRVVVRRVNSFLKDKTLLDRPDFNFRCLIASNLEDALRQIQEEDQAMNAQAVWMVWSDNDLAHPISPEGDMTDAGAGVRLLKRLVALYGPRLESRLLMSGGRIGEAILSELQSAGVVTLEKPVPGEQLITYLRKFLDFSEE